MVDVVPFGIDPYFMVCNSPTLYSGEYSREASAAQALHCLSKIFPHQSSQPSSLLFFVDRTIPSQALSWSFPDMSLLNLSSTRDRVRQISYRLPHNLRPFVRSTACERGIARGHQHACILVAASRQP